MEEKRCACNLQLKPALKCFWGFLNAWYLNLMERCTGTGTGSSLGPKVQQESWIQKAKRVTDE